MKVNVQSVCVLPRGQWIDRLSGLCGLSGLGGLGGLKTRVGEPARDEFAARKSEAKQHVRGTVSHTGLKSSQKHSRMQNAMTLFSSFDELQTPTGPDASTCNPETDML
jgi:hypothetical protein